MPCLGLVGSVVQEGGYTSNPLGPPCPPPPTAAGPSLRAGRVPPRFRPAVCGGCAEPHPGVAWGRLRQTVGRGREGLRPPNGDRRERSTLCHCGNFKVQQVLTIFGPLYSQKTQVSYLFLLAANRKLVCPKERMEQMNAHSLLR